MHGNCVPSSMIRITAACGKSQPTCGSSDGRLSFAAHNRVCNACSACARKQVHQYDALPGPRSFVLGCLHHACLDPLDSFFSFGECCTKIKGSKLQRRPRQSWHRHLCRASWGQGQAPLWEWPAPSPVPVSMRDL